MRCGRQRDRVQKSLSKAMRYHHLAAIVFLKKRCRPSRKAIVLVSEYFRVSQGKPFLYPVPLPECAGV